MNISKVIHPIGSLKVAVILHFKIPSESGITPRKCLTEAASELHKKM